MAEETTTIEITEAQRDDLDALKHSMGVDSYKAALGELLEDAEFTVAGIDESQAREIAREVVNEEVTHKALQ